MDPVNHQILVVRSSFLTIYHINSYKIKIDIYKVFCLYMIRAVCRDYGFDCDYVIEGSMEKVVQEFGKHTTEKHGIEYSEETLTKFMLNNTS